MVFSIIMKLGNHYHDLNLEHFHDIEEKPCTHRESARPALSIPSPPRSLPSLVNKMSLTVV